MPTGQTIQMMDHQSNKNIVARFYKQVIGMRDASLIPVLVSEDYIQHSPTSKDGREGLTEMVAFLKRLPRTNPTQSPVRMLIADGDLVAGLLDIEFMGKRMLVIDLFRIRDGMLMEHWDASEEVTPDFDFDDIDTGTVERKIANKALIRRLFETDALFRELQAGNPGCTVKLMHVIGEGDTVVSQSAITVGGTLQARYDIFRIANGAITKRWSICQTVPERLPHGNGMF